MIAGDISIGDQNGQRLVCGSCLTLPMFPAPPLPASSLAAAVFFFQATRAVRHQSSLPCV